MTQPTTTNRRRVLKTIGAGVVGSAALVAPASADGKPLPRQAPDGRLIIATWGDDEIWELTDAEPPEWDTDEEGNHNAHEPLYLIKPIPDAEHSPHFPADPPVDHVVPVPGGTDKQYSAQWHPKVVLAKGTAPVPSNLVNQDQDGNPLTSSERIENATNVTIFAFPEETVFTCPVRPHNPNGD